MDASRRLSLACAASLALLLSISGCESLQPARPGGADEAPSSGVDAHASASSEAQEAEEIDPRIAGFMERVQSLSPDALAGRPRRDADAAGVDDDASLNPVLEDEVPDPSPHEPALPSAAMFEAAVAEPAPTPSESGGEPQARTPSIVNVSARAATPPIAPEPRGGGAAANAAARAGEPAADLHEFVSRRWPQAADAPYQQQLDRRVLMALSGDYEAARAPLEGVSRAQAESAAQLVETLIAIREGHGGDPAAEATRALAQIERLRAALIPASDLSLPRLVLCRSVLGLGLYEPIEPAEFRAGTAFEFVAYCEIRNLNVRERAAGGYETLFDVKLAVLTQTGQTVVEQHCAAVRTAWRDARHECFIAPLVGVPASISPGEHVLRITVTDRIGMKVAERSAPFRVAPPPR